MRIGRSLLGRRPSVLCVVLACGSGGCGASDASRNGVPSSAPTIELEQISVVSNSAPEVNFGDASPMVLRDRRGRVWVRNIPLHQVAVFDSDGRFLRLVGAEGEGPGEFVMAVPALVDSGDSVWIWDARLHRATVYSPELEVVRTVPLRILLHHTLPDGSLLAFQTLREPARIGYPAHRVSRDGTIIASFGEDPPRYREDQQLFYSKIGTPTADGLVWMTARGRYEPDLWDPTGEQRLRSIQPDAPWFHGAPMPAGDFRTERPPSTVTDMWMDDSGLLWALSSTAAPDWAPCCDGGPAPHEPGTREMGARYVDMILQAIDPLDGSVLGERVFRDFVRTTRGGGYLVTADFDGESETVRFSLWRPMLSHPNGR